MPVHHVHICCCTHKKKEKPQKCKTVWETWYLQLIPRTKPVTVLFYRPTRLPRLVSLSPGKEQGESTRPFRAEPTTKQIHLGHKIQSAEAQKDTCLVFFQQKLDLVCEDSLSYQVQLFSLCAPGLLIQVLLFISCCELNCGQHRAPGPTRPGHPWVH